MPGRQITDHQMELYMITGRRTEAGPRLPSQKRKARGRRRPDPLAGIFAEEIVPLLEASPGAAGGGAVRGDDAPASAPAFGSAADDRAARAGVEGEARAGEGDHLPAEARAGAAGAVEGLLADHGMEPSRNNRGRAYENGSVEGPHGHLKRAIDDALLLRGSRDFETLDAYRAFVTQVASRRTRAAGRGAGGAEAAAEAADRRLRGDPGAGNPDGRLHAADSDGCRPLNPAHAVH